MLSVEGYFCNVFIELGMYSYNDNFPCRFPVDSTILQAQRGDEEGLWAASWQELRADGHPVFFLW